MSIFQINHAYWFRPGSGIHGPWNDMENHGGPFPCSSEGLEARRIQFDFDFDEDRTSYLRSSCCLCSTVCFSLGSFDLSHNQIRVSIRTLEPFMIHKLWTLNRYIDQTGMEPAYFWHNNYAQTSKSSPSHLKVTSILSSWSNGLIIQLWFPFIFSFRNVKLWKSRWH